MEPRLADPSAHLVVPCSIANDLIRVMEDTAREFDLRAVRIHRDGNGDVAAVMLTPEEYDRLRAAAGEL